MMLIATEYHDLPEAQASLRVFLEKVYNQKNAGTRRSASCPGQIRTRVAGSRPQRCLYAPAFLMNFLRHGEIFHFDEGAISFDRALAQRNDEFADGYASAACSPALPVSG
jgi:hypothetical protein